MKPQSKRHMRVADCSDDIVQIYTNQPPGKMLRISTRLKFSTMNLFCSKFGSVIRRFIFDCYTILGCHNRSIHDCFMRYLIRMISFVPLFRSASVSVTVTSLQLFSFFYDICMIHNDSVQSFGRTGKNTYYLYIFLHFCTSVKVAASPVAVNSMFCVFTSSVIIPLMFYK